MARGQGGPRLPIDESTHGLVDDADPALFRAYLGLAEDHMDVAAAHVLRLSDGLRPILEELRPPEELDRAQAMVQDALTLFHSPFAIARHRDRVTDARARAVIASLTRALRSGQPV